MAWYLFFLLTVVKYYSVDHIYLLNPFVLIIWKENQSQWQLFKIIDILLNIYHCMWIIFPFDIVDETSWASAIYDLVVLG
jgi:hypothetical protein